MKVGCTDLAIFLEDFWVWFGSGGCNVLAVFSHFFFGSHTDEKENKFFSCIRNSDGISCKAICEEGLPNI